MASLASDVAYRVYNAVYMAYVAYVVAYKPCTGRVRVEMAYASGLLPSTTVCLGHVGARVLSTVQQQACQRCSRPLASVLGHWQVI